MLKKLANNPDKLKNATKLILKEKLLENSFTVVHRVESAQKNLLLRKIKITNGEISEYDLNSFNADLEKLKDIDHPNLEKPLKQYIKNEEIYILYEDIPGQTMQEFLLNKPQLLAEDYLDIASQLVKGLKKIHELGLLHRFLSPANIIIYRQGNKYKIKITAIGLGRLVDLRKITNQQEGIKIFGYFSPERCGIINWPLDQTNDIYSLGIIFYELFTGQLPFLGDNLQAIISKHGASLPRDPALINLRLPEAVGHAVLKMLEKHPRSRYQSAEMLLKDIERYSAGKLNFVVAPQDGWQNPTYYSTLIGRKEEIAYLKKLKHRLHKGHGGLCFITGESGIGKTRIIDEYKTLLIEDTLFLETKIFNQGEMSLFNLFGVLIDQYLYRYSFYSPEVKNKISEHLSLALGELINYLTTFKPALNLILGNKREDNVSLETQNINLFTSALSIFWRELTKIENGLVIFLDDIQPEEKIMQDFFDFYRKNLLDSPCLIVSTVLKKEKENNEFLKKFNDSEIYEQEKYYELQLNNLAIYQNDELIRNIVSAEISQELSAFVFKRSNGNPYLTIEILRQLWDNKALHKSEALCQIDNTKLDKIVISESIYATILSRLSKLSEKESNILFQASLLGRIFSLELLLAISTFDKAETGSIIEKLCTLQILEESLFRKGFYYFVDERLRQGFYNSQKINVNKFHEKVANYFERKYLAGEESALLSSMRHYLFANKAEKIIEYGIVAAKMAEQKYDTQAAIDIYQKLAESTLGDNENRDLNIKARHGLANAYLILGRNSEALGILNEIWQDKGIKEPFYRARLAAQISEAYYNQGDWQHTEIYSRISLKIFKEAVPTSKFQILVYGFKEIIQRALYKNQLFKAKNVSVEDEIKYSEIIKNYQTLVWLYALDDNFKLARAVLRLVNIAENYLQDSLHLARVLYFYIGLNSALGKYDLAYASAERCIQIATKYKDNFAIALGKQGFAYFSELLGNYDIAETNFKESLAILERVGGIKDIGMTINGLIHIYLYTGKFQSAKIFLDRLYKLAKESGDDYLIGAAAIYYAQFYGELAEYELMYKYAKEAHEISSQENKKIWLNICTSSIELGRYFFFKKDYIQSKKYYDYALKIRNKKMILGQYANVVYIYRAELTIAKYLDNFEKKNKIQKNKELFQVDIYTAQALRKTKNLVTHYGAALRLRARYLFLQNKNIKAKEILDEALDVYRKYPRTLERAKILFDKAMIYKAEGNLREFQETMEAALRLAQENGGRALVNEIINLVDFSRTERLFLDRQKINSILHLNKEIQEEKNYEKLLEKTLANLINISGAQRGYIFLASGDINELHPVLGRDNMGEAILQDFFAEKIVLKVLETREFLIIDDAFNDDLYKDEPLIQKYRLRSIACLPLQSQEKLLGVCYLDNPLYPGKFSPEYLEVMMIILNISGVALDKLDYQNNLEKLVNDRTKDLEDIIKQQSGDYYLMKLLTDPLTLVKVENPAVRVSSHLRQYKKYQIKNKQYEIGGDINIATDVRLKQKPYVVFLNADAMGKSSQGAGGILVFGSLFRAILERTKSDDDYYPENWLAQSFMELQKVFAEFEGNMRLSFFIGLYEDSTNKLYYLTTSEHPPALLLRNNSVSRLVCDEALRKIGTPEIPGVYNARPIIGILDLEPGDQIFTYSDGVYDLFPGVSNITDSQRYFEQRVSIENGDIEKFYTKNLDLVKDDISLLKVEIINGKTEDNSISREKLLEQIHYYQGSKDHTQTLNWLLIYLEKNPLAEDLIFRASILAKKTKRFEIAEELALRIYNRQPQNYLNLLNLAEINFQRRNKRNAEKYLAMAAEINPGDERISKINTLLAKLS